MCRALNFRRFWITAIWLLGLAFAGTAYSQTTSFTYQGRLTDGGAAANGNYDLQFALWDSASSGTQIGSTQAINAVAVSNGVFTVSLDFGASSFPGASRYLEISARTIGAGSFTLLTPRQQVTSTPYAVRSTSSANADTATTATNAATATNATQLGGVAAGQYVQTNDSRLADARSPTAGSTNYVQNTSSQQTATNFNISGNGTVGGTLTGNIVNSSTQFNIGGLRVFGVSGSNQTPPTNTFAGVSAGEALTPFSDFTGKGTGNSFFGNGAGQSTTIGFSNSFFGLNSGTQNVGGGANAFFGFNAGFSHTSGNFNAFFGADAGQSNNTGSNNTALGGFTDVGDNLTNATAIGANAQVGQSNSLVLGSINGVNLATADTNVGIGTRAPSKRLEVGTSTIADGINLFGTAPAFFLSDAGKNEKAALGFAGSAGLYSTDAAAGDLVLRSLSGRLILQHGSVGAGLTLNSSNTVSISTLGSAGSSSLCRNSSNEISNCSSSLRYKTNVASFFGGLNIINRLRPISFEWKQNRAKDIGLGAEEVEKVEPLLTFRNDKGEIEGVKYNQLSAVFINAIKEQQTEIEQQRALNEAAQRMIKERDAIAERQQVEIDALNAHLQSLERRMRTKSHRPRR